MSTKEVEVEIRGNSPYIMSRFYASSEMQATESKRGKRQYIPEDEAAKKAYKTSDGKFFIPSIHFKTAMVRASTDFKMQGKKSYKEYCKAGMFIVPTEILITPQKYTIYETPVVIGRARVLSWYPQFKEWTCKFTLQIADDFLDSTTLKEILVTAGKYKGIGNFRPEFGRFEVTKFQVKK